MQESEENEREVVQPTLVYRRRKDKRMKSGRLL